jgi:uncharacterized protein YfaS (alpha-2-macroglobulin family)
MNFLKKPLPLLIILFFYSLYTMAQTEKKYDSLWKKVEDLTVKKGLTKSALAQVDKIYLLAKKDKDQGQIIKALLYQLNLQQTFEDNADQSSLINKLEKQTGNFSEPALSILNSVLADRYFTYFQQLRYKFYNRTETINFKNDDISTWSAIDFHQKISNLYLQSISNKKLLQQTKLETYDPIITKGNSRYLRPTLYDLLANRAMAYFKSDERDINKPAYAFEINNDNLFLPAESFVKLNISTSDSLSLHHKALLVCQELIAFHMNDPRPDALIDADITRIQLVHQYAVQENKENLYRKALDHIFLKYNSEPSAAKAGALLAQWHVNKASTYQPLKDSSNRFEYIKALEICEKIVQQKQESEGKSQSLEIINQVKHKEIILQTEKVNVPNQPFRTLVGFRNFTQLYLRVISINADFQKQLKNGYDDNYWKLLTGLPATRTWNEQLPATEDHQKHSAEIKIDALPSGNYILLASVNEDFSLDKNPVAVQYFYVSGISFINTGNNYFILDRKNGNPLEKATVQFWYSKYNASLRKYVFAKGDQFTTDKNGYFQTAYKKTQDENYQLEIHYKKDQLFLNDYQYRAYRNDSETSTGDNATAFEEDHATIFFFSDRSIYRPGQTFYFKGIAITKDFTTGSSKVYPNKKSWVNIYNANNELLDSLQVTTNEYGSYSGKFKLPEHGLNGIFRLEDKDMGGELSFSVEEYKRPRFYVAYEKLKNTYKINDSIQLTGYAKAYAGNNIDGASVKYRVMRTSRFIYPWLYWKTGIPRSSDIEITNGSISTNAEGKFTVKFKAIPDASVNKKLEPVFDYKVIADITDINGETRSAETFISVSYKSIVLMVNISQGKSMSIDSVKHLSINTRNLNDEFVPALVHVIINKLQTPGKLIRKRYWQQPDLHILSKEVYTGFFPYDEYEDETNPESWRKLETVYEHSDSSKESAAFEIVPSRKIVQGWYSFEVTTKDENGGEIKDIQYLELVDEKSKTVLPGDYTWSMLVNPVAQPGQKSSISIGSSAANLFIIQQVVKQQKNLPSNPRNNKQPEQSADYTFINLDNEKKSVEFPVTENDRGGFGVSHFFIKNNRFYIISNQVKVPWTNKELTVSYESFRDKTLPGSEEKWKLKISGSKNEKIAGEMLASMYDASLDQFKPHSWGVPDIWPEFIPQGKFGGWSNFSPIQSQERYYNNDAIIYYKTQYDALLTPFQQQILNIRGSSSLDQVLGVVGYGEKNKMAPAPVARQLEGKVAGLDVTNDTVARPKQDAESPATPGAAQTAEASTIQIRKNFNETAFFLPDLKTDSMGNISFGFTIPEALTTWKFQAMAHTKDAAFGYSTKEIVTQKKLMVQPNAPRFFREGDRMELSTKIVNMSDKELTGIVHLELFNAADMQPVDGWFQNMNAKQHFTIAAGQSVPANFSIHVPYRYNSAIVYRFTATSDSAGMSDGEEAALPVLTNSMLVTESLPLTLRGNTTKNFHFEKLLRSGSNETLQQHSLTIEFSSNPAWYAVQALPYLIEYPYECSEQTFNRFYANALATKIVASSPRIKSIFEKWRSASVASKEGGLLSNLEKNSELKLALLEETPWVLEAKNESQQKKNIALLFDMVRMSGELEAAITKLQQLQLSNGGFSWFKDGPDDRFITQYILTGIGHLKKLKSIPGSQVAKLNNIIKQGIPYLDKRLQEDYNNLIKYKTDLAKNNIGYLQIQYLYMRSFFTEYGIPGETFTAANYYRKQSQQYWVQQNKYTQGMIALSLHRSGDHKTANDILKSLKENAIVSQDMGTYWKENRSGYFWYQAPVEAQSLLIEAFSEIANDTKITDDLKTWLVLQKQTQRWASTKATADACYALLLQGSDWLSNEPSVEIKLGSQTVKSSGEQQDAGTGYFKKVFDGPLVKPAMGDISVTVSPAATGISSNTGNTWGSVYWQYFENLDKITPSATPLQLTKKLFVEKNSDRGPILEPVTDGSFIKLGDKIKVRIELRVDRDMEYVHMKDMRAGCMEPVNVLSGYKYQGGLGYYESTKDASTSFFFNWLPKGVYVFEYPLFATQAGNFSNGVTSIQCMYAPEFSSHSEGIRINVK